MGLGVLSGRSAAAEAAPDRGWGAQGRGLLHPPPPQRCQSSGWEIVLTPAKAGGGGGGARAHVLGLITVGRGGCGGCGEPGAPGRGALRGRDPPSPLALRLGMLRAARRSGQAGERRQERAGAGRQEGAGRSAESGGGGR